MEDLNVEEMFIENQLKIVTTVRNSWRNFSGILLGIVSGIFLAIGASSMKFLDRKIYPGEIALVGFVFRFIFILPVIIYNSSFLYQWNDTRNLFLYCFVMVSYNVCAIEAIQRLTLEESATILGCAPIVVNILARITMKEKFSFTLVAALILSTSGVILVTKLPQVYSIKKLDLLNNLIGILCGCLSMCFISLGIIIQTSILRHYRVEVLICYYSIFGCVLGAGLTTLVSGFAFLSVMTVSESWLNLSVAASWAVSLYFSIWSGRADRPGIGATSRTVISVLLSALAQFSIFGQSLEVMSVVGSILVLLSGVLLTYGKYLSTLPEGSSTRKRLRLLVI